MSVIDVYQFHKKFGLPLGDTDQLMGSIEIQDFRIKFMQEELNEFNDAVVEGDRVKAFDALLDLVYVVYGTALFMGIDPVQWNQGMYAVHDANMSKVRAASVDQSKRQSTFDVVKPPHWVPPEAKLEQILNSEKLGGV